MTSDVEELLVKSRHRVKTYGEVFTPRRMVDRMLDLVHEELENSRDFVDTTVLEPAAGDGNFLVAILHRKLRAIQSRFEQKRWPSESLFALASIYGVELLEDNYCAAKDALMREFRRFHQQHQIPSGPRTNLSRSAAFLIEKNVVRGNTLTGLDWQDQEIEFSWWNRILTAPEQVQREPFTLPSLLRKDSFDFAIYEAYKPCRIDRVHEELTADE